MNLGYGFWNYLGLCSWLGVGRDGVELGIVIFRRVWVTNCIDPSRKSRAIQLRHFFNVLNSATQLRHPKFSFGLLKHRISVGAAHD
jgi:hypothetical protein